MKIAMNEQQKTKELFDQEIRKCIEKYSDDFNLSDIKDDYHRNMVALLLENQQLINSNLSGDGEPVSQDVVRLVYGNKFRLHEWIGFNVMLGPVTDYPVTMQARTRKMKIRTDLPCGLEDFANNLRLEIEQEVFMDVKNNCGTVSTLKYNKVDWNKSFQDELEILRGCVYQKSKQSACILIIPEHLKDLVAHVPPQLMCHSINAPDQDSILIAAKSDPTIPEGFFYNTYVPFTHTPVENFGFASRPGILTRYAKKLTPNGSKLYARLDITNVPNL